MNDDQPNSLKKLKIRDWRRAAYTGKKLKTPLKKSQQPRDENPPRIIIYFKSIYNITLLLLSQGPTTRWSTTALKGGRFLGPIIIHYDNKNILRMRTRTLWQDIISKTITLSKITKQRPYLLSFPSLFQAFPISTAHDFGADLHTHTYIYISIRSPPPEKKNPPFNRVCHRNGSNLEDWGRLWYCQRAQGKTSTTTTTSEKKW